MNKKKETTHKNPLVSVIIPTYNSEQTLKKTMDSALNQTYNNLEIIVVDDFSNDNTIEMLEAYKALDDRIQIFQKEENMGVADSRNIGIEKTSGEFIAFLDSDDVWKKDKVKSQLLFMQENKVDFSYTDYEIMNTKDELIAIQKTPQKISYFSALSGNMIGCSTVMFNLANVGKVSIPNLRKRNDAALWLKVLKITSSGYRAPGRQAIYYKSSSSLSSGSKTALLKYHFQMYKESEGFNSLFAATLTGMNIIKFVYKDIFFTKKIKN